jgi:hypothetical protein
MMWWCSRHFEMDITASSLSIFNRVGHSPEMSADVETASGFWPTAEEMFCNISRGTWATLSSDELAIKRHASSTLPKLT